ncbi:MAG: hydrogenase maturation protease, partial [Microcystaceae cyanobacterium]
MQRASLGRSPLIFPTMNKATILIIGYGNTLRNDDGIGPYLAEQISLANNPLIKTIAVHQLTPELVTAIAEVEQVIFIDANSDSGCTEIKIKTLEAEAKQTGLDHTGSPSYLLALTKSLYGRTPKAWLMMIPAQNFEFGETFSDVTTNAIPQALTLVSS